MRGSLVTAVVMCLSACVRHIPGERHTECRSDADCLVGQCLQFKSGRGCEVPCAHPDGKPDQRLCPRGEECFVGACVDGYEPVCSGPPQPLCHEVVQVKVWGPLIQWPRAKTAKTPLHGECGKNSDDVATSCAEGRCMLWGAGETFHVSCELHCTLAPYDSCPEGLECVDFPGLSEQLCRPKGERRPH